MDDLEARAAAKFYKTAEPAAAPTGEMVPESAPAASSSTAEKFYGPKPEPLRISELPAGIKELREGDAARKLYSAESNLAGVNLEAALAIPAEQHEALKDQLKGTPFENATPAELTAAMAAEFREMSADLGASPADLSEFMTLAGQMHATPPDEKTIARWHDTIGNQLRATYGDEAPQMLDLARQLAQRDPRVARMLDHTGLGNHPDVVMKFARLALSEKLAGRLK